MYVGAAGLNNSVVRITTDTAGVLPHAYDYAWVTADPAIKSYTYTIRSLESGIDYYVAVSAENAEGMSNAQWSIPRSLAPPVQKASEPSNVYVVTHSASSLKLLWKHPESHGGSTVTKYKIEWQN